MNVVSVEFGSTREVAKNVYYVRIRCEVISNGSRREYEGRATGTLQMLLKNWKTPQDVWLDRLQECPEEAQGMPQDVAAAVVGWCRTNWF